MDHRHQVVVVGAGFGGLRAARALADVPVDVTVVDQRNHHTFQPLLYQVATAGLDVDDICYPTRGIFQRQENARALRARVTGVDFAARMVETETGPALPYDTLVLALGAVTADFGVPGVDDHAFGLKSAAEAQLIRNHVLAQFERAERSTDTAERCAAMTIVVVGGGPTGVEMSGGFAELVHRVLRRDFPRIDIDEARIILIEGEGRLLSTFEDKLGKRAHDELTRMGVDVRLETMVTEVGANSVRFSDLSSVSTNTVVWAAGVRAHPLAAALGLDTTRAGRVIVDEHLRIPGLDGVYVLGDLAASTDVDGSPLPQVAAVAIQGGTHVARCVESDVTGRALPEAFQYRDKGSMATIGRNSAVAQLPRGLTLTGFVGWVAWLGLHLIMLIGFRNRANVLVNWAWNYLTYDRGSRLIIELEPDAHTPLVANVETSGQDAVMKSTAR